MLATLHVGKCPRGIHASPDRKLFYIANENSAGLSIISASDGKLEKLVPVKSEPEGVALTPDGKRIYVTCRRRVRGRSPTRKGSHLDKGRPQSVGRDRCAK